MTWTTVCDFPFREYQPNLALDVTDFHNDAQISGSIITHDKYVTFEHPDDQLVIPVKDDSLQRFTGLKVEAVVYPTTNTRRLNIVEGWMSFAFFIESDRTLFGTVYDGQNWVPVTSNNVLVPLNEWSRVSFEYDGVCIGKLTLNGARVGANINMPMGMHQPRQNITIGHWPSGDGRYTFMGEMGRVRISRRDYEDFWRDTVLNLVCRRQFSPRQADAMKELIVIMNSLDSKTKEAIQKCAKARSEKMLKLFRTLRAGNKDNIVVQQQLGDRLLEAWCCKHDVRKVKQIMLEFFGNQAGPPDSEHRRQFLKILDELFEVSAMCENNGPPFDRMRELLLIAIPELAYLQVEMRQLIEVI